MLGEVNPLGSHPRYALYHEPPGHSGDRLRRFLGISVADYLSIDRRNLCTGRWSIPEAKAAAASALEEAASSDTVVLSLGRKVATALGAPRADLPSSDEVSGVRVVFSPHPSGLCRAWNDPAVLPLLLEILREWAGDWPWGGEQSYPSNFVSRGRRR